MDTDTTTRPKRASIDTVKLREKAKNETPLDRGIRLLNERYMTKEEIEKERGGQEWNDDTSNGK